MPELTESENTPGDSPEWPNKKPIIDGVVPTEQVSQDPNLNADESDEEFEMLESVSSSDENSGEAS